MQFHKYVAAGNDFVVFDGRETRLSLKPEQIHALCDRRFGIGADGVLVLGADPVNDFRMHYFNADGSRGEMCGNGARSLIHFAVDQGAAGSTGRFQADDGAHHYRIQDQQIQVEILVPGALKATAIPFPGCGTINTGVPHLVVPGERLVEHDLDWLGHSMNPHPAFSQGTNVNLVNWQQDHLSVRTWERGVNAETLACGTGAVATAIFAVATWGLPWPLLLEFKGGPLIVDQLGDGYWLSGPTELVFRGQITLFEH